MCAIHWLHKWNTKYIDVVKPKYNLIEYSENYLKTSGSLWQDYRDDPNNNITESESFKYKIKITAKTPAAGNIKDVETAVPLKYLSNFLRTPVNQLWNKFHFTLVWRLRYFFCNWRNKI